MIEKYTSLDFFLNQRFFLKKHLLCFFRNNSHKEWWRVFPMQYSRSVINIFIFLIYRASLQETAYFNNKNYELIVFYIQRRCIFEELNAFILITRITCIFKQVGTRIVFVHEKHTILENCALRYKQKTHIKHSFMVRCQLYFTI